MHAHTQAIILAAGASRRLGQPKQLILWHGQPLLRRVCLNLLEYLQSVTIVTGAYADRISPILDDLPVQISHCPDWSQGMSISLRTGLSTLPSDCQHILLCVCDQLLIPAEFYGDLLIHSRQNPDKIIAASYQDVTAAVPAIFPIAYRSALSRITGDKGARALLKQQPASQIISIPCPEASFDLDNAEDLHSMRLKEKTQN